MIGYLVEPGATHYGWSEGVARFTSLFIRQAARRRIVDRPPGSQESARCRPLDVQSGALTTTDLENSHGGAAYAHFAGDRSKAFWHLDLDLARAADAFHSGLTGKQPQFVTFSDPKSGRPILPGHDLRIRLPLVWTSPDTFALGPTFLDGASDKYPQLSGPVGHAAGPVQFKVQSGALELAGPTTFRVRLAPADRSRPASWRIIRAMSAIVLPNRRGASSCRTV